MMNLKNKKIWAWLFSLSLSLGLTAISGCSLANNTMTENDSLNSQINSNESISESIYKYEITLQNNDSNLIKFISENPEKTPVKENINGEEGSKFENNRLRVKSGYNTLDKNEKLIYNAIVYCVNNLDNLQNKNYDVKISTEKSREEFSKNLNSNIRYKILRAIENDYPEFFVFGSSNVGMFKNDNNKIKIIIYSYFSKDDMLIKRKELDKKVDEILKNLKIEEIKDTRKKVESIYDYMCNHCEYYDEKKYEEGKYPEWIKENKITNIKMLNSYIFNSYGALCTGKSACGGVARAFQLLLNKAGIDCRVVINNEHTWNIVKIDNKWICVDVTWDLGEKIENRCWFDFDVNKLEGISLLAHSVIDSYEKKNTKPFNLKLPNGVKFRTINSDEAKRLAEYNGHKYIE